jgi:phage-related protein
MRPVEFVGQSREDLRAFPDDARQNVGHALYLVQNDRTPTTVKPLHGFGTGVREIRARGEGGTYRAVFTVALPSAIYVLHAFQKKSPRGAKMAHLDQELIRARLAWALRLDAETGKGDEQ